ncbi:hypothetical protein QNI16_16795 [Cytophagaceae bacterium YF14B1]|uniref:Uncharacterized protein n=1 Tax=Xanthocytophaga flava TaxID=3048013 RepID=A0AAE3U9W9_9BACT|nr:hypothetical protein [Xanthocytophaga flavus]MDJ1482164.1 hypothetical protein [Xanthocytophaga flavus]
MVFSSPLFLFLFLPITLLLTYLTPAQYRNIPLLLASLLFYVWGESEYSMVMIFSAGMNYLFGRLIERNWGNSMSNFIFLFTGETVLMLVTGLIFTTPIRRYLEDKIANYSLSLTWQQVYNVVYTVSLFASFTLAIMYLAANTYNPFIYFRF